MGVFVNNAEIFTQVFNKANDTIWAKVNTDRTIKYLSLSGNIVNYFTLYYDLNITVRFAPYTLIPSKQHKGHLCISVEEYLKYNFYDYAAIVLQAALANYLQMAERTIKFKKLLLERKIPLDREILKWCIEAEINEHILKNPLTVEHELSKDIRKNTFENHNEIDDSISTFEDAYITIINHCADKKFDSENNFTISATAMTGNSEYKQDNSIANNREQNEPGNENNIGCSNSNEQCNNHDQHNDDNDAGSDTGTDIDFSLDDSQEDDNKEIADEVKCLEDISEKDEDVFKRDLEDNDEPENARGGFGLNIQSQSKYAIPDHSKGLHEVITLILEGTLEGESDQKGTKRRKSMRNWSGYHTRYAALQKKMGTAKLPPTKRLLDNSDKTLSKAKVAIYLDTSGSCANWAKRFFNLVHNMNHEQFDITLFSFSDGVKSHDINIDKFHYHSGGTNIQSVLRHAHTENLEESQDAIIVLTDAHFQSVSGTPLKEAWHWVLTDKTAHQHTLKNAVNKYFL